ncbi:MAG TPA: gamma carbonic anhydrase family protein [Planctomycetota bacterium]|jgi:carbonic anhydrase/acetyltransferase-like protein (isoleucine patch superfamily)
MSGTPDSSEVKALQTKLTLPYPSVHVHLDAICARPVIDPTAWVAPTAVVNGRVTLKAHSSVWYGCVLRGDTEIIEVGEESNVQDGTILHTDEGYPCIIGKRVTIGHAAVVHGAVVQDNVLIGIGATVLSRCVIGEGALIAAGALVLEGTKVPPSTLWVGAPARQVKEITQKQRERFLENCLHYVNNGQAYLARYGREHIDRLMQG